MSEARLAALLIDLDGTLVDSLGDFVAALTATGQDLGLPAPPPAVVRDAIGRGGPNLIRSLLAHWQRPAGDFDAAWALYQTHYAAVNGRHALPFAGTHDGLAGLAALGLPLACVTNKPTPMAEALLQALGLRHCFAVVVGQETGVAPKPAPDALLLACQRLGVAARRTWMVGDSRNDAEAALAAGCAAVVLLRHGYNHGEPIEAVPARAHLDRLDQLPGLLARHLVAF